MARRRRAVSPRVPPRPPRTASRLYFENLSADTSDAYLVDGLTDEIISRLGQIERLQVKSRTAVARYRATTLEPSRLGRALGGPWDEWRTRTEAMGRALVIEPQRSVTALELGYIAYINERYADARRWADSSVAMDPSFYFAYQNRGYIRLALGDTTGARNDATTAVRLGDQDWSHGLLAVMDAARSVLVGRRAGRGVDGSLASGGSTGAADSGNATAPDGVV